MRRRHGPRWEAARSRTPVLLPYVRSMTHDNWPVFGKALTDTGVRALFVFPLVIGAMDVGTRLPGATDSARPGRGS